MTTSAYVLRPPFAQERLRLRGDGRIALELKRAWHDGTRELVFGISAEHLGIGSRPPAARLHVQV